MQAPSTLWEDDIDTRERKILEDRDKLIAELAANEKRLQDLKAERKFLENDPNPYSQKH
jgi:hypothetical protein